MSRILINDIEAKNAISVERPDNGIFSVTFIGEWVDDDIDFNDVETVAVVMPDNYKYYNHVKFIEVKQEDFAFTLTFEVINEKHTCCTK